MEMAPDNVLRVETTTQNQQGRGVSQFLPMMTANQAGVKCLRHSYQK